MVKIYLAQINNSVGDFNLNAAKIMREFERANQEGCDLAVFCEMTICGYPCRDLWNKKYFFEAAKEKILEIAAATKGSKCAILLGAPTFEINRAKKEIFYNSAILIENGEIKKITHKKTLANQGVFDEKRYFESAVALSVVEFRGLNLAFLICEDLWDVKNLFLLQEQILDGVIAINASPYSSKKHLTRQKVAQNFVKNLGKPLIYVNQVGAQDGLVFDGGSFAMNQKGEEILQLGEFIEDFGVVELEKSGELKTKNRELSLSNQEARDYSVCVLGLRDYIQKNGFAKVLLGMSGGVDSALVATIAVDALGAQNVELYALPSRFNSETSMIDALNCAQNLGVKLQVISIEEPFKSMLSTLGEISQLAQENLQARIRGNILMALSNNSGALLLSTGNKSELACGYATLYGDMCGAFNSIKDLYKTRVWQLSKWRNENFCEISALKQKNLIPQNIITKAPTAELRDNQKDSDNLPEYQILDQILFALIEEKKSVAEIIELGFEEKIVKKTAQLFYASEYKRSQSCLGVRISEMAFGLDWRYPITNKFNK